MNAAAFFYIYSKISSCLTDLLHALHFYRVGLVGVLQSLCVSQLCYISLLQVCHKHVKLKSCHHVTGVIYKRVLGKKT